LIFAITWRAPSASVASWLAMTLRLSPSVMAYEQVGALGACPSKRVLVRPSPRMAAPPNEPGRRSKAAVVVSMMMTSCPALSKLSARTDPTRPHPTMTVFT
jgi:hypothetical protein